jgi:hypothetical protein
MPAPETITHGGFPEQERPQQQIEGCPINEEYFCFDNLNFTTGKTELYVGHNNFRRLEGKPTEIT